MLEQAFNRLYLMFRANYYRQLVKKIGTREGCLSATESYCVELIHLLDAPTVSDFAAYLNISVPNANYKINSLVTKGYVTRQASETDRREQHLHVTDKFLNYYSLNDAVIARWIKSIRANFSAPEIKMFENMLERINLLMDQVIKEEEASV